MSTASSMEAGGGARIAIRRRIDWIDTDASGHWHYAATFRLVESAESELHRALDIVDVTFGSMPRVRVTAAFLERLYFGDEVELDLRVDRLGGASVTYAFEIRRDGLLAVEGEVVTAFVDAVSGRASRLPDEVRTALANRAVAVAGE